MMVLVLPFYLFVKMLPKTEVVKYLRVPGVGITQLMEKERPRVFRFPAAGISRSDSNK